MDAASLPSLLQKADLLRSQERYPEALATIEQGLNQHKNEKRLLLLKVQTLFEDGNKADAIAQTQLLKALHPTDEPLIYYLALITLEQEEFKTSEQLFGILTGIEEDPNRGRFYLGVIAQQQEQFELAIERFDKVDTSASQFIPALARTSSILDSPKDKADMQQRFDQALSARQDLETAIYAIEAEWLEKHGFVDDALAVLDEALSKHPDDADLLYTRALSLELIDFSATERDLKRIIELDSNNATALNALGYTMLLNTERYDEAMDYIARALKLRPNDVSIIDSMGWAHYKLGNYDAAVEYLERAYAISQNEEIAGHLIISLWALGHTDRAQQLLKESLQKSPNDKFLLGAANQIQASWPSKTIFAFYLQQHF